jgi:hypothetical protein
VLIRIADTGDLSEASGNVGDTNYVVLYSNGAGDIFDPNPGVFRSRTRDGSRANQPLLPIVIYRQQVTNDWFPKVSGDVTQVSPLIERIPWRIEPDGDVLIPDRLFAGDYTSKDNQHFYFFLYVRDQQPVLAGAAYQYFVVRFNAKREVQEVVPAGQVTIPKNP